MKVLYDITSLGRGYMSPTDKTGIFRVVDNLYQNLVQASIAGVLDLHACSTQSYLDIGACRNFTRASSPSYESFFCNRSLGDPILSCGALVYRQVAKHINLPSTGQNKLFLLKALRYLLRHEPEMLSQFLISRSIIALMARNGIEIYHSPFFPVPPWINNRETKTILTVHDIIAAIRPDLFTNQISGILNDILDSVPSINGAIICVSQHTKEDLCNYFGSRIDPDNLIVTHLAAADHFCECESPERILYVKKKYNIPPESRYFLSVNTLEPRKNIAFLIRCFKRLVQQEHLQDLALVLVGRKGWKYRDIFEELESSPIKNRIIIAGFVPDEDLSALYSGALAFIYPSLYEGFGLPPLEAMQCGVPVITSSTSSLPEVVGDAGIMIDPTDSDGLCEGMLNVCSNAALRNSLSQKSLQQAGKFSWKKCSEETINVYRTVIDRHSASLEH